jgi:hypothetical protein
MFTKKLTLNGKINLLLTAILTFYLILVGTSLRQNDICGYLGTDYCAFWTGGQVMNEYTTAAIYDMDVLGEAQEIHFLQTAGGLQESHVVPLPYLPIFMVPFRALALLDIPYSYFAWTAISLVALVLYLRFFIKDLTGEPLSNMILLLALASLPVFLNLKNGQLNIWLCICTGEYLRALFHSKPMKAGAWLGGLLLKPQLLIFILPLMLFRKSFKALAGFIASALVIGLISFGLVGTEGFLGLANLLLDSAQGGASSYPQYMINWRMVGLHVASLTSQNFGWIVIIAGSILTTFFVFRFFLKRKQNPNPEQNAIWFFGVLAATLVVTWHSHGAMAVVLIPPMLYLLMKEQMDKKLFLGWVVIPVLFYFILYLVYALISGGGVGSNALVYLSLFEGLPGFIYTLIFLAWSIRRYQSSGRAEPESSQD